MYIAEQFTLSVAEGKSSTFRFPPDFDGSWIMTVKNRTGAFRLLINTDRDGRQRSDIVSNNSIRDNLFMTPYFEPNNSAKNTPPNTHVQWWVEKVPDGVTAIDVQLAGFIPDDNCQH